MSIPSHPSRSRTAFTLIELLVVIAIIGLMIGAIGFSMKGGNSSTALQSGRGTLASLLSAARGQAALSGKSAAILLNGDPTDRDRYMRYLVVAVQNTAGGWDAVGSPTTLPKNIFVLPPDGPTAAQVDVLADWTSNNNPLKSSAFSPSFERLNNDNGQATTVWFTLSITELGTTTRSGDVCLAVGETQGPASTEPVKYMNPNFIRGVKVSSYGVATFIDERASF